MAAQTPPHTSFLLFPSILSRSELMSHSISKLVHTMTGSLLSPGSQASFFTSGSALLTWCHFCPLWTHYSFFILQDTTQ